MNSSVAGGAVIMAYALLASVMIGRTVDQELEQVRGMRVAIAARTAVKNDERPKHGTLTVVQGTALEKVYKVHTASVAREGTMLSADDAFDKARADRHVAVTTNKRAIRTRLPGGGWRATVPNNDQSAELVMNPKPVIRPSAFRIAGVAAIAGVFLMILLGLKLPSWVAAPAGTVSAFALLTQFLGAYIDACSSLATAYLTTDGGAAAFVAIDPVVAQKWVIGIGVVATATSLLVSSNYGSRMWAAVERRKVR